MKQLVIIFGIVIFCLLITFMIRQKNANLDPYMNSLDGPISNPPPMQSAFTYNTISERDAVGNYNLGNFNFNKGSGGTVVLGGTTNGNGVLSVQNASGSEVVRADNTGLTVKNGSISIQDSTGTAIIDSTGLVSAANFLYGNASDSSSRNTTSGNYGDLSGGSLTTAIFPRTTNVLVLYSVNAALYTNSFPTPGGGEFILNVDGTDQGGGNSGPFYISLNDTAISATYPFSRQFFQTSTGVLSLGSGTHILKIRWRTGIGNMYCYASSLTYIALGK